MLGTPTVGPNTWKSMAYFRNLRRDGYTDVHFPMDYKPFFDFLLHPITTIHAKKAPSTVYDEAMCCRTIGLERASTRLRCSTGR